MVCAAEVYVEDGELRKLEQEATRSSLEIARGVEKAVALELENGVSDGRERERLRMQLIGIRRQILELEKLQRDGF